MHYSVLSTLLLLSTQPLLNASTPENDSLHDLHFGSCLEYLEKFIVVSEVRPEIKNILLSESTSGIDKLTQLESLVSTLNEIKAQEYFYILSKMPRSVPLKRPLGHKDLMAAIFLLDPSSNPKSLNLNLNEKLSIDLNILFVAFSKVKKAPANHKLLDKAHSALMEFARESASWERISPRYKASILGAFYDHTLRLLFPK
jgi:hypothetical protein